MRIGVLGSSESSEEDILKKAEELGMLLAQKGCTILTGACNGIPHKVAMSAHKNGAEVIGYSPAGDEKEHRQEFGDPVEGHTSLVFIPKEYEHNHSKAACYKYRNISLVLAADKVIIIGGRFGTLNEFTIAYEFGKEIGVLSGTGGASSVLEMEIIQSILDKINKQTGAKVIFESDPKTLIKEMGI